MGFGTRFPANQLGGQENVWAMGEYGFRGVWVMRELTVPLCTRQLPFVRMSDEKFGCALPPKRKGIPRKEMRE